VSDELEVAVWDTEEILPGPSAVDPANARLTVVAANLACARQSTSFENPDGMATLEQQLLGDLSSGSGWGCKCADGGAAVVVSRPVQLSPSAELVMLSFDYYLASTISSSAAESSPLTPT
jgi:hypothetical protein